MRRDSRVLVAAALGGVAGHVVFFWLAARGYYGMALPGGMVGLAAGVFQRRSAITPFLCALLALAVGLFTQWRFAPFIADPGSVFFLSHLSGLPTMTLVMIGLGTLVGFWVPFRRHASRSTT